MSTEKEDFRGTRRPRAALYKALAVSMLLGAAASFGACASTRSHEAAETVPAEVQAEALALAGPQVWTHAATGMVFPATIAGFTRDDEEPRDPHSEAAAVNYKRLDGEVPVMVTVYIYPRGGAGAELDDHFFAAKAAVLQNGRGTELLGEGGMTLAQDGELQRGRRAHFLIANENEPYPAQITHLFLFAHGPWFIKYRTIFLAFQHAEADVANLSLMETLAWPTADRGRLAKSDATPWLAKWTKATTPSTLRF